MSLLIPSGFFGTTEATSAWWTEIAQKAWRDKGWHGDLDRLELIPVDSKPGPINVWNYDRRSATWMEPLRWQSEQECWQVNWILESWPADYDELEKDPELHQRLLFEAIKRPWYWLGMLNGDFRFLPFLRSAYQVNQAGDEFRERVTRPLLRAFIRQLPQLTPLDERIFIASGRSGLKAVGVRGQIGIWLDYAKCCGALPEDDWYKIPEYPLEVVMERMNRIYEAVGGSDDGS
jgi:hypothetical protein